MYLSHSYPYRGPGKRYETNGYIRALVYVTNGYVIDVITCQLYRGPSKGRATNGSLFCIEIWV